MLTWPWGGRAPLQSVRADRVAALCARVPIRLESICGRSLQAARRRSPPRPLHTRCPSILTCTRKHSRALTRSCGHSLSQVSSELWLIALVLKWSFRTLQIPERVEHWTPNSGGAPSAFGVQCDVRRRRTHRETIELYLLARRALATCASSSKPVRRTCARCCVYSRTSFVALVQCTLSSHTDE